MPLSFNPNRLKVQLKLAINRLKLTQQKKNSMNKRARKEIAALLENNKEESARIRVEGIIREDYYIEAMEMLELYCELLMARFGVLEQMNTADPFLVNRYLEEIAKSYNVNWKLSEDMDDSLVSIGLSFDSKISNNKLEPFTALPDMDLLMSLNDDTDGENNNSNNKPTPTSGSCQGVSSFVPPDNHDNKLSNSSSSLIDDQPSIINGSDVPPPYSKNDNQKDDLPDFDEL
ncbi:15702_t:CDS:2, partial [Acaulospora colombiana]